MRFNPETGEPKWSPRVRKEKIRRLYQNDARGILAEELLYDVGTTLYCRCESILDPSAASMVGAAQGARDRLESRSDFHQRLEGRMLAGGANRLSSVWALSSAGCRPW